MAFHRGDILLVPYPYTDLKATKTRPAVVISSDRYHEEQPDFLLAALTTNVSAATGALDYKLQDWSSSGLRFPTAFKPVIVTLDPSLVVYHIGSLSLRDLTEINFRLRLALDLQGIR